MMHKIYAKKYDMTYGDRSNRHRVEEIQSRRQRKTKKKGGLD